MLQTNADRVFDILNKEKTKTAIELAEALSTNERSVMKIAHYLEEENILSIKYTYKGALLSFVESVYKNFSSANKDELITILREFKKNNNVEEAKKLMDNLFEFCRTQKDPQLNNMYKEIFTVYREEFSKIFKSMKEGEGGEPAGPIKEIESYKVWYQTIVTDVHIVKNELEPVPFYNVKPISVQSTTEIILEKIKETIISALDYEKIFHSSADHQQLIRETFKTRIMKELIEVFPDLSNEDRQVFVNYLLITSIGLGDVEFLLKDANLEEIVINNAYEPVWVYHKGHGWLKTNIVLGKESKIRHFATIGGRIVDKNITNLEPLLDGHLESGDRFNATLAPISSKGNTITIRKFAEKPWTIVDLIKIGSISIEAAAIVWLVVQYEMSFLIVGGTGSGKTSTLNVFSVFIPPNQRIISIEDTRELLLANTLHWVAMQTRPANPEGKGEVTVLDLIVNALRMRPDRILFGEIRRKAEAETLFEAMHTGHSAIATFHSNNAEEALSRLTNPPIDLPKLMLSSLSFIMVMNRNRRTGKRVLLQFAEVTPEGEFRVVKKFNYKKNVMETLADYKYLYDNLELYAGLTHEEVNADLKEKEAVLKRFSDLNINDTHELGMLLSKYYTNKDIFYSELEKREKDAKMKPKERPVIRDEHIKAKKKEPTKESHVEEPLKEESSGKKGDAGPVHINASKIVISGQTEAPSQKIEKIEPMKVEQPEKHHSKHHKPVKTHIMSSEKVAAAKKPPKHKGTVHADVSSSPRPGHKEKSPARHEDKHVHKHDDQPIEDSGKRPKLPGKDTEDQFSLPDLPSFEEGHAVKKEDKPKKSHYNKLVSDLDEMYDNLSSIEIGDDNKT